MGDEYDALIDSLGAPAKKAKAPLDYRALYQEVGKKHGVDPDLLYNQAKQESVNFNPHYVYGPGKSPKGAAGLSQFMPDTARKYGLQVGKGRDDRYNPHLAADAQARMMRELIDKHGDATLALSAYNSGSNKTSEQARRSAQRIPETRGYVQKIAPKGDKYDQLLDSLGEDAAPSEVDPYDALLDSLDSPHPTVEIAPPRNAERQVRQRPVGRLAGLEAGVGGEASTADFSSVPGSPLAAIRRKPALPMNPSKIAVKPKPFRFSGPSDEQLLADLRVQVAGELAPEGGTRLLASGAGRGQEIEQEAQRRLADMKAHDARALLGPSVSAAPETTKTDRVKQAIGAMVPAIGLTRGLGLNQRDQGAVEDFSRKYAPGLSSLDTPMGVKTDLPRGVASGLTLGAVGAERPTTSDEQFNPQAGKSLVYLPVPGGGTIEFNAHEIGEMAGSLAPLIGGGRALAKVGAKLSPAARTSILFGGVETGKQAVNAAAGRDVDLSAPLMSAALGSVMGKLEGHDAGLLRRVVAYVSPGLAVDIAKGVPPEQAAKNALTNFGFAVGMGGGKGKAERAGQPTVPENTQMKLAEGEARTLRGATVRPMRLREAVENARQAETQRESEGIGQGVSEGNQKAGISESAQAATSPEANLGSDIVGTEPSVHHSQAQNRRVRNTEHGNRGQFKSGKVESPEQVLTSGLEPATPATPSPETLQAGGVGDTTLAPSPARDFAYFKSQGMSNAEAATRAAQESAKSLLKGEPTNAPLESSTSVQDGVSEPIGAASSTKPIDSSTGKGVEESAPEPTVPETPATLVEQVRALESGTRDAVLITPGAQRPKLPERMASLKTKVGVFYFDPAKVSRETIQAKVKDGTYGSILGHVSEKPAAGEPTAVVTARSPEGVEVQSSAVPPEKVSEQVAATQAQNPEAKVEVGGPELAAKVLSERIEPDFVRAARERKVQRESQKAEGIKQMHSGADPYELLDDIIIRGHEIYSEKIKPTFQQWSKRIRDEFGPESDEHLKSVWSQLSGEKEPVKTSKLASGVETKAVEAKLAESFEGLSEYETIRVKDQADAATRLLQSDPARAERIAMGREVPPIDVLPESVFIAVENKALKDGNVELLRNLATASTLPSEASGMGQRIRMLAERNPNSAVGAMREVQLAREAKAERGHGNLKKARERIKSQIKVEIKRTAPKIKDWESFLETIKC